MALYAGRDITEAEADRISRHLMDCPACYEEFESWRNGVSELAKVRKTRTVPVGTWDNYFNRIERGIYRFPASQRKAVRLSRARRIAVAASFLLVALVTGMAISILIPDGVLPGTGPTVTADTESENPPAPNTGIPEPDASGMSDGLIVPGTPPVGPTPAVNVLGGLVGEDGAPPASYGYYESNDSDSTYLVGF